jgi:hypothetical protein
MMQSRRPAGGGILEQPFVAKKSRDEFAQKTVFQIAKRAAFLCSFPSCRTPTVGATEDGKNEINIGTAAHICAAAPGGPRYDENMSEDERSSADNGIWMCRDHGKAIDSDVKQFTTTVLREWKKQAELESWRRVLRNEVASPAAVVSDAGLATRLPTSSRRWTACQSGRGNRRQEHFADQKHGPCPADVAR